jgi:lysophospholipase L1-like esterase
MPSVVCFGDSNTWGYAASSDVRLGRWERWPGVLQRALGDDWHVHEEGLNGRTTVYERDDEPNRNGLDWLPVALETHHPVDWLVISLGTNDLFAPGAPTADDAAEGAGRLVDLARSSGFGPHDGPPRVLVLAPPAYATLPPEDAAQAPGGERESQRFGSSFRAMAQARSVTLLDLGDLIASSPLDGIHFEAADHAVIGTAVAAVLARTQRAAES